MWRDLAQSYSPQISFGEVDVMSERVIVTRFQVVYYPSFVVIQNVCAVCLYHIGECGRVFRFAQSGGY